MIIYRRLRLVFLVAPMMLVAVFAKLADIRMIDEAHTALAEAELENKVVQK